MMRKTMQSQPARLPFGRSVLKPVVGRITSRSVLVADQSAVWPIFTKDQRSLCG